MGNPFRRRVERRVARGYQHKVASWSPCYHLFRRPCLRCWWREVTGRNARDKAVELQRMREVSTTLTPIYYHRETR